MLCPLLVLCCQSILRCCVSTPLIEPACRRRVHVVYIYLSRLVVLSQTFTPDTVDTSSKEGTPSDGDPSPPSPGSEFLGRHTRQVESRRLEGPLTAPRGHSSSQNTEHRSRDPHGTSHGDQGVGGRTRSDSVASSWVSLSSIGAERRRWLAAVLPSSARSGWLMLLLLCWPLLLAVRRWWQTRHTGQCRGAHSRTTTANGERAGERARAFLKRDSRTGADTPPHPRIFRLAPPLPRAHSLSPSLSLTSLRPPIFLSRSLARSRACALSLALPFSPPALSRPYVPASIAPTARQERWIYGDQVDQHPSRGLTDQPTAPFRDDSECQNKAPFQNNTRLSVHLRSTHVYVYPCVIRVISMAPFRSHVSDPSPSLFLFPPDKSLRLPPLDSNPFAHGSFPYSPAFPSLPINPIPTTSLGFLAIQLGGRIDRGSSLSPFLLPPRPAMSSE